MIRKPAPFFSTEAKANFILQKFFELVPLKDVLEDGLKIQDIYDSVIYPEYEAVLVENRNLGLRYNQKVLGKYSPKENLIFLDTLISPDKHDPRRPFVLAHEIGHAVYNVKKTSLFVENWNKGHEERLANNFARNLLAPETLVRSKFSEIFSRGANPQLYSGPAIYWFKSTRKLNIFSYSHYCNEVANFLTPYFSHMSKESMAIQLIQLGLIKNTTLEKYSVGIQGKPDKLSRILTELNLPYGMNSQ